MTQKYIEGDIVMYDNKVMVVKEPRDGNHFDLSCHKEGLVYCLVDIDEIKPVSLTPEILEKNGWERVRRDYFESDDAPKLWLNENIGDSAVLYDFDVFFTPKIFKMPMIRYVHQLQHYFFGLSIKIKIEV